MDHNNKKDKMNHLKQNHKININARIMKVQLHLMI